MDSAFSTQVGGSHYKVLSIQPTEYIIKNGLGFCEGNVVKYATRYKLKGGVEDLMKARHYIDMLIELHDTRGFSEKAVASWYAFLRVIGINTFSITPGEYSSKNGLSVEEAAIISHITHYQRDRNDRHLHSARLNLSILIANHEQGEAE